MLSLGHSTIQGSKHALKPGLLNDQEDRRQSRAKTFYLGHSTIQCSESFSRPPNTKFTGRPPVKSDRPESWAAAPVERLLGHICLGHYAIDQSPIAHQSHIGYLPRPMKPIQEDRRQSRKQDVFSLGLSLFPVSQWQPNIELTGPPPSAIDRPNRGGGSGRTIVRS